MKRKKGMSRIEHMETPKFVTVLRAAIRPVITLALTAAFLFLLFEGINGPHTGTHAQVWREMMTIFLAVYGPIVGFWFGQQTALKQRPVRTRIS